MNLGKGQFQDRRGGRLFLLFWRSAPVLILPVDTAGTGAALLAQADELLGASR